MPKSCPHEFIVWKMWTWPKQAFRCWQNHGFSGKRWREVLPGLGRELEAAGKSTEAEFLAIGGDLEGFHRHAGEISKLSTSVARLMSGEAIATVIQGFGEVVDRIRQLQGASRQNAKTLAEVLETLARLHHQLSSFRATVRTLRVLCVSTRMESARFGQRDIGFNGIAEDVEKLAVVIEEKTAQLLTRAEELSGLIGEALVRVSELETTQHAQAELILDKTMANLEALSNKHHSSAAGVEQISRCYDAISRNIGEVVASMQIHDITRQRIEHAAEALDRLTAGEPAALTRGPGEKPDGQATMSGPSGGRRGLLPWRWRSGGSGRADEDLRTARAICGLQAAQLRRAKDLLVAEVENILENLSQVAGHVVEMSQEMAHLAGTEKETGRPFLSEIETGFTIVRSALGAYGGANRELSSVMHSVSGTLREMSAFSGDIEGIGAKIRLIALNAIVKASSMGEEGASLAVLAEAVHQLSVGTCERTGTVGETLRLVLSASDSLVAGMAAEGDGRAGEEAHLGEALQALLENLHEVSKEVGVQLVRINDEGRELSEGIHKTVAEVNVHHRLDRMLSEVVAELEEIVGRSSQQPCPIAQSEATERVRALEAAYTMQGEREVHQAMVTAGSAAVEKTRPSPCERLLPNAMTESDKDAGEANAESESALGDNVELF